MGKRELLAILVVGGLLLAGYLTYPIITGEEGWRPWAPIPVPAPAVGVGGYMAPGAEEVGVGGLGRGGGPPPIPAAPPKSGYGGGQGTEMGGGSPGQPGSTGYLVGGEVRRQISYTGWMSLEVEDVPSAAREIASRAQALGGYVASSSVEEDSGSVSVKVPADSFGNLLSQVRGLGEVREERINANDVTDQIVDLQARLDNARAEEERLLELYSMATDVSDLLEIERALSDVRERIEVLQAELQNLESSVTYATLTVYLERRREPTENLPSLDWWALAAAALRSLYGAVYLIVILFFGLIPIAAVVGVAYLIYRRVRPRPRPQESGGGEEPGS